MRQPVIHHDNPIRSATTNHHRRQARQRLAFPV
jgi:hypothetical protein